MSGRILIVGSAGQVGVELQRSFADYGEITARDRDTFDLADPDQVRALVREVEPSIILNAAAYTAVDRAESDPEAAMAVNALASRVLAEEALRADALLVHYSTDYVFDGSKPGPWVETDKPHPLNVYGASKLAGEEAIQKVGGKYLIFRTSWVYGPHGNNFLLTMLRLGSERDQLSIVDDQYGAPTTSIELADATRAIVGGVLAGQFGSTENWAGLYHMTCAGQTSWYDFARTFLEREAARNPEKRMARCVPISSSEFPLPARRPRNSVLSNEKLRRGLRIELPDWSSAMDSVLQEMAR